MDADDCRISLFIEDIDGAAGIPEARPLSMKEMKKRVVRNEEALSVDGRFTLSD